jgi:hypothetical protein
MAQGATRYEAQRFCNRNLFPKNQWENDEYTVIVDDPETGHGLFAGGLVQWLAIQRRDGSGVRDWCDLQAIKSEIVGPEYEAVELCLVACGQVRMLTYSEPTLEIELD